MSCLMTFSFDPVMGHHSALASHYFSCYITKDGIPSQRNKLFNYGGLRAVLYDQQIAWVIHQRGFVAR